MIESLWSCNYDLWGLVFRAGADPYMVACCGTRIVANGTFHMRADQSWPVFQALSRLYTSCLRYAIICNTHTPM